MLTSIRQRLVLLVFMVAIPLMAATLFVIHQHSMTQRDGQRDAMLSGARILIAAVDAEIETYLAIGRTLSVSPSLRSGDLRQFYDVAVAALSFWPDSVLVVADATGRQVINTTRPFGGDLPVLMNAALFRRTMETKNWQVSDVFTGQVSQRRQVSIYVPVIVDGVAAYCIVIAVDPGVFRRILQQQQLPDGFISGIIDNSGLFVARTRDHARYVGTSASSGWRDAAKVKAEGQIDNISVEGDQLYSAFAKSNATGWSASIGADRDLVVQPFRRSLLLIAIGSLGLLGLSLAFAWWVGRRIVLSLQSVERSALAMQRGEKLPLALTGLNETDQALRAFDIGAAALMAREEQFQTLADSIPQLAWMANADGAIFWYNRRWYEYTGTTLSDMQGWGWQSVHDPRYVDGIRERFQNALKAGTTWEDTFPLRGADGHYRWFLSRALPVRDSASDEIVRWFGTNTDISEQKMAVDRQRLMTDELNHRVKNTLAVIQSMATVTSRSATSVATFSKSFIARIMSISRTHDVLTEGKWEAASLREILVNELSIYEGDHGPRIEIVGGAVTLSPKAAVDFGMIIHELATNAAKYGSLSVPDGRLKVEWQWDGATDRPALHLDWLESGGPPVRTPDHRGFGSRLIEQVAVNSLEGRVEFEYRPDGLRCHLRLRLAPLEVAESWAA